MNYWTVLSFLGDSALMLPSALLITLWLGVRHETRPLAWRWALAIGFGGGLVAASKIAFMGWRIGSASLDFTGFSGHTALATAIWPVLLWLLASRWHPGMRWLLVAAGWMLGVAIGMSRLVLDAHSLAEVVFGFALGFSVSAYFLWFRQPAARPHVRSTMWMAVLVLPALLVWRAPAPTQDFLEMLATRLAGIPAPYTRDDLHEAHTKS